MSFETIRINELAKELGLSSKEVIEKFAQISIAVKTHSSTVTMEQVKKLKEFLASGGVKEVKKPKAFVVKKAKETPVVEEAKQEVKEEKIPGEKEAEAAAGTQVKEDAAGTEEPVRKKRKYTK